MKESYGGVLNQKQQTEYDRMMSRDSLGNSYSVNIDVSLLIHHSIDSAVHYQEDDINARIQNQNRNDIQIDNQVNQDQNENRNDIQIDNQVNQDQNENRNDIQIDNQVNQDQNEGLVENEDAQILEELSLNRITASEREKSDSNHPILLNNSGSEEEKEGIQRGNELLIIDKLSFSSIGEPRKMYTPNSGLHQNSKFSRFQLDEDSVQNQLSAIDSENEGESQKNGNTLELKPRFALSKRLGGTSNSNTFKEDKIYSERNRLFRTVGDYSFNDRAIVVKRKKSLKKDSVKTIKKMVNHERVENED